MTKRFKNIYFVGIKGVAMTALAVLAREMGIEVSGSDVADEFPTDSLLARSKIPVKIGFKKENISGRPDLVVVTGAHGGMTNPEAVAAKKMGLSVLMHGQALGVFMEGKEGISVAGCHGKTTTTALIAALLIKANLDPSFLVGAADVSGFKAPAHFGRGKYFVAEADEYMTDPQLDPTPRFLWQNPKFLVFTSIDFDHPDAFSDIEEVKMAFLKLAKKIPADGLLVANIDDKNVADILPKLKCNIITYGFSALAQFQITHVHFGQEITFFRAKCKNQDLGEFTLKIPGRHNVANAGAAAVIANTLGVGWPKIKEALSEFSGAKRRFEFIGNMDGVSFYDDYAHHPSEIAATLAGVRAWFPKTRIIVVFQPHTYSRTKALFFEFAKCFSGADEVIILPIFPSAREEPDPGISSEILVGEIKKYQKNARFIDKMDQAADYLKGHIIAGDIILTMGAGDIYKLHSFLKTASQGLSF